VIEHGQGMRSSLQNTAILLDKNGEVAGMSHKIMLLAFGEYIPLADLFPILREWIPEAGNFRAGKEVQMMELARPSKPPVRIMPLICYEDILPVFGDQAIKLRAEIMVNITNDAWFGKSGEPALHLQLAAARSVEARRPMVRSTNTGISAFIDPAGRILDPTSLTQAEYRTRDVPLLTLPSWHGLTAKSLYWLAILWSSLLLLGDLVLVAPRRS
jgi:apolipoprotein N-acyltransferase